MTGNIEHIDVTDRELIRVLPNVTTCARINIKGKAAPMSLIFGFKEKIKQPIDFTVYLSFTNPVPDEKSNIQM